MIKRILVQLAVVTLPLVAGAQGFQPGKLPAAARDSFDVMYQGQAVGAFIMSLAKAGDNFTLAVDARLPAMGVTQVDTVIFHATSLAPVLVSATQSTMGQTAITRISVRDGKATGSAQRPGPGGIQTIPIDATVPAGVIAEGADAALIPTLDLSDELVFNFKTYDAKTNRTIDYELKVLGKETVTVPAGTFEAWKVQLTGSETALVWITTADPKKLVMLRLDAAQLEMKRVK